LQELRDSGQTVPILMLTARDAVDDRIKDWIGEPTITLQSHSSLGNCWLACELCCGGPKTLQPTRLVVADLVVNTAAQTVERGGKAIL